MDNDPDLTAWQALVQARYERDIASGVAWHPQVKEEPAEAAPTKKALLRELRLYAASLMLASSGKFVPLGNPEGRLDIHGAARYLKQQLGEAWADFIGEKAHEEKGVVKITETAIDEVVEAVMYASGLDPRYQMGDWSGKSYSAPGNPSPRLFRKGLWDINTWVEPEFRHSRKTAKPSLGAFQDFLDFCLPRPLEQGVLLDWLAWSLQNEARRPNWAIFLFSEEKGTGKSTILNVARALFGEENTARENGLGKLMGRFALESVNKKLITIEEVKITSFSEEGNRLKEFITGDRVSVDVKYQAAQTLPLVACFLLTTNHRPVWLEGGERRYYIIHLTHDGHAQGPRSEEFKELAEAVDRQIKDQGALNALYEALLDRVPAPDFSPNGLKFSTYASPIMRDLLEEAVIETDEVLEDLLQIHRVAIIPSSRQKHLERYLGLKAQQLRNQLTRLGWKSDKISIDGHQQRFWIRQGVDFHPELSRFFHREVSHL